VGHIVDRAAGTRYQVMDTPGTHIVAVLYVLQCSVIYTDRRTHSPRE
jgi:hypothetical protein